MTSERDFDRIARAWLDLGPNEAPDRAIAAVIAATETTRQVRRPFPMPAWRQSTMTRITMLAVLAGTIAIVIGGLVLTSGGSGPSVSTAPASLAPAAAPSTAAGGPLPDALIGGWVGPLTDGDMTGDQIALLFGALDGSEAPDFKVSGSVSTPTFQSSVAEPEPGVLRLTLDGSRPDCARGAAGTYDWSQSADGQWLTLDLIDDACAERSDRVSGSWQRSLAHDSRGGPGIEANFLPYLQMTLPDGTYVAEGQTDTILIDAPDRAFKMWKDLDGFVDPCDIDAGRLDLEPGMDGFLAYLTGDPRFTVTSQEEFLIDGHRAVEVQFKVGESITAPCWDFDGNEANKTGVLTWVPHASTGGGFWNGPIDSEGMLVVTEVDGTALIFEPVTGSGDDWSIDRATLDTIRFLDALPTPPSP